MENNESIWSYSDELDECGRFQIDYNEETYDLSKIEINGELVSDLPVFYDRQNFMSFLDYFNLEIVIVQEFTTIIDYNRKRKEYIGKYYIGEKAVREYLNEIHILARAQINVFKRRIILYEGKQDNLIKDIYERKFYIFDSLIGIYNFINRILDDTILEYELYKNSLLKYKYWVAILKAKNKQKDFKDILYYENPRENIKDDKVSNIIYNINSILYKVEQYWNTEWFRCLIHLRSEEIEFNSSNKVPYPFEFILLGKTADINDECEYDLYNSCETINEDPDLDIINHITNSSGCVLAIKEKNSPKRKSKRTK